ncbi:hypothetical protein Tco_0752269 [Tanacetum coccineum]|uniref:Uncharacterized protein n=1 Tax=Tanacetum coccineum TaxID=301880 RepID=A0ABQ4Z9Y5_9ASTR
MGCVGFIDTRNGCSFGVAATTVGCVWVAATTKKGLRGERGQLRGEFVWLDVRTAGGSMFGVAEKLPRGRLPTERLTPDENEARSDWWVSSRAYFDRHISEAERDMSVGPVQQPNKGLTIVDKHYGLSDFSELQSMQENNSFFEGTQATPSYSHNMATLNWQTPMPSHPGTSNWQTQMPSRLATPNWQTLMPSHPHDAGLFNPNILNRARREAHPSMYRRTPYIDLHPTTVEPKKRGNKTKNKGKNANLSPLNLGNAFADDNVGGDDVMCLGEHDAGSS